MEDVLECPIKTDVEEASEIGERMVVVLYRLRRDLYACEKCCLYGDCLIVKSLNSMISEVILEILEIPRKKCWLTTLVKVFLFDEDHVKKYKRLGKEIKENKSNYSELALKSMPWMRDEIEIANPKAIILLGPEVISSMLLISIEEAKKLITGEVVEKKIIWKNSNFICLPPPGVIMDRSASNPWPRKLALQIGPKAAEEIKRLEAQPSI